MESVPRSVPRNSRSVLCGRALKDSVSRSRISGSKGEELVDSESRVCQKDYS